MVQEYAYQPLESNDTIRILVLQPSNDLLSPLEADIVHKPRRIQQEGRRQPVFQDYTAISYHWGPPNFSHSISCGGRLLPITSTVHDMLRRLRKTDKQRKLWIDAICLNQTDTAEKAVQIRLMTQIYRESHKVIIWLGEPAVMSRSVKTSGMTLSSNYSTPDIALDAVLALKHLKLTRGVSMTYLKAALELLMSNPWFGRRWVIQEATAHAHTIVHYGGHRVAWLELASSLNAWNYEGLTLNAVTAAAIRRVHRMQNPPKEIFDLLLEFAAFECGEKSDRIAALQGLSHHEAGDNLRFWRVDYTRHWTQNYASLARAAIFTGHSAEIYQHLRAFGALAHSGHDVSQCVPDWSRNKLERHATDYLRAETVSLGTTFDVRDVVHRHLVKHSEQRLLESPLRGRFTLNEITRSFDSQPYHGEVAEIFDYTRDESPWTTMIHFISMTSLTEANRRRADLIMEVLPVYDLASKYFDRWRDESAGISRFREILSYLIAGPWKHRLNSHLELNTCLHLSAESGPGMTARPDDKEDWRTAKAKLDLLDFAILNDVLCPAMDEMLKTLEFCTVLSDGELNPCLATRGIKKDWLVVKEKSSQSSCRVFRPETGLFRKVYRQTELIAFTLDLKTQSYS